MASPRQSWLDSFLQYGFIKPLLPARPCSRLWEVEDPRQKSTYSCETPMTRALGRAQSLLLKSSIFSLCQGPSSCVLEMAAFSVVRGMSQVLKGHWKILKAILLPQLQARRVAVYPYLNGLQRRSLGFLVVGGTYLWVECAL